MCLGTCMAPDSHQWVKPGSMDFSLYFQNEECATLGLDRSGLAGRCYRYDFWGTVVDH